MASSQMSPRFVIFVVVSLLTHLMDVAASGLFCHLLMQQEHIKTPWFSISVGFIIIPMVGLQLISAVYLLRRKGETSSSMEVTLTAVLHVLQLGFISRHFAILQESSIPSKKYEIAEMLMLRLVFSLTSGCPLLLIKLYMLFQDNNEASWDWAIYLTIVTAVVAITWALATFRRNLSGLAIDTLLITCPGTILKISWRAGEILTRVIALSLFASLYTYWFFLVIGLHWLAMIICVCVPAITPLDIQSSSSLYRCFYSFLASFTYIFIFINTSSENAIFRYTFYYIIFFLENTTLVTVWLVQASTDGHERHDSFVYVAAASFVVSIFSMTIYYKFFHIVSPKEDAPVACSSPNCLSCKLNVTNSHPPIPPRPEASGHWLGQYHTAIYCGQYCKHNVQDSLLDSTSERNSVLTLSSSQVRLQQKLATIDNEMNQHAPHCNIVTKDGATNGLDASTNEQLHVSPRSKPRKKNKKKNETNKKLDSKKVSSMKRGNTSEDSGSQKQPVWLPSGDSNFAHQLLTYSLETFDTNDTADDERSSVTTGVRDIRFPESSKEISSIHKRVENGPRPVQKHGDDRHWYSDGYSTDRTLDWPNYPVSSLQRNMFNSSLDTDEDQFHCPECFHGDSEVLSIMRSIDGVPSSSSPRGQLEVSPRSNSGNEDRKHSHHNHHHHHHHHHKHSNHQCHIHKHQRKNQNADPKATIIRGSKVPSKKDSDRSDKGGWKPHSSNTRINRTQMVSSPASDPSHGPKPKRKGSPKRRFHGSAHPNFSTMTSKQTLESNSYPKVQEDSISCLHSARNTSLAQSERIAKDLLAKSSKKTKTKEQKSSAPGANSDPRFNVRVMVSQNLESHNNDTKISDKIESEKNGSLENKYEEERDCQLSVKTGKKAILGVTEKETDIDQYSLSPGNEEESTVSPDDVHVPQERFGNTSAEPTEILKSNTINSTSSSSVNNEEVIYENIWQVKKEDETLSKSNSKIGFKNRAFVDGGPSKLALTSLSSPKTRDTWYMCSESEDSALPPEILSSSVDGFTASENGSDVSVEIVI